MKNLEKRQFTIIYFFIAAAVALAFKVASLQIFDPAFSNETKSAALYRQTVLPSRGIIVDRNGELLVANAPTYDIMVTYRNIDPKMDTLSFCNLLGIQKEDFKAYLAKDWKSGQFSKSVPFVFMSKVSPERFAYFKEHMYKYPGFFPELRSTRAYPHQNAAHVLGYLGEVDRKIIKLSDGLYSMGDYIGKTGLEKMYERELGGVKGVSYILKDNLGRKVGSFDNGRLDSASIAGLDIESTLDLELQAYAEKLFANKRGSLVAIEPSTGEILAMVSSPTYDPNVVGTSIFDSIIRDNVNKPIFDRSVKAEYPPGSIFKCIFSLIAMQKGVTNPDRGIGCSGAYYIGGGKFQKCHSHPMAQNISMAIQYSCNSYYYQLMRDMVNFYNPKKPGIGLDTLVAYLNEFGLGHPLGTDNVYENDGFIPDSKFYDHLYRREASGWKATYMLSLGIGQGELQLTTVQMANIAAAISNRGYFITPHLIRKFRNSNEPIPAKFKEKKMMRIDQKYYNPVVDGMQMAVKAGTATRAFLDDIEVCGKTGTSQNPFGEDHSVFFGFAPKNNPKIAIAVFVENAGFGARYAVPIGGLVMEKYLTDTIRPARKYLEDDMFSKNLLLTPDLLTEE
ncbi:MAG: penicillin-binding protein 2 [Saprospiraceae bacterium]|nr:penicillin-binding protein 2 [Saprospiraceae bacterium]